MKKQKTAPTNFEDIVDHIGGFGKYQLFVLVILGSLDFPSALQTLLPTYTGVNPEFWTCDGMRVPSNTACTCNGTLSAPQPYTSMVAEWGLGCEKSWVADLITSVQLFGTIPGVVVSSSAADWYGRRIALKATAILFTIGAIMSALAPDVYIFALGRFLVGAGSGGCQGLISVYLIEFMPIRWRPVMSSIRPYGIGVILLGGLAYYFRPWRTLAWATTTSIVIATSILWVVPESPRWLMLNDRITEAHDILGQIAKMNDHPPLCERVIREIAENEMGSKDAAVKNSYLTIFSDIPLRKRAICFITIWFFWDIIGYGLTFNIKNMPGNPFLNMVYIGTAEIFGSPSSLLITNRFGRRGSVVLAMSLATLCLITITGIHLTFGVNGYPELILGMYMLTKYLISVGRAVLRCATPESFPTPVRSIGGGLCGISNALGVILCPQLAYLGSRDPSIPLLAFAVIGVVICLLGYCMPETEGKPMEDTIGKP